jgi:hypothetical protein
VSAEARDLLMWTSRSSAPFEKKSEFLQPHCEVTSEHSLSFEILSGAALLAALCRR